MLRRTFFILAFSCALVSSAAFGQGVMIAPQTALKTVNGVTSPIANASITVCAANTGGVPCSPALAGAIFKDAALTQPLSNPFTADANGNYQFAIAAGNYTVTVTGSGFSGYSYQISATCPPSAACTWTATQIFTGSLNVSGTSSLSGGGSLAGTFSASGAINLNGGGTFSGTFGGNPAVTGNWSQTNSGAFTVDSAFNAPWQTNINGFNFLSEYQKAQGSHGFQGGLAGAVVVPAASGTPVENSAGIAGFAVNNSSGGIGVGTAAVGGYFQSRCAVNGSHCWASTHAVFDTAGLTSNVQLVGQELDVDPLNPLSAYSGIIGYDVILGAANAGNFGTAFLAQAGGTGIWAAAFGTNNGAANVAVSAGALCSSGTCNSQPIQLFALNSGSNVVSNIFSDNSGNIFTQPAGSGSLVVTGAGTNLTLQGLTQQIAFNGNTHQTVISVGNPAATRVWSIADLGGNATFAAANQPQTFSATQTFSSAPVAAGSLSVAGTGACATITTTAGGSWAGTFKCTGTTGASTVTITPGITAPNGFTCSVFDETTRANLLQQTSHSTTTCVLTATSVTQNDVFTFSAIAF